jgi:hypothetical protein
MTSLAGELLRGDEPGYQDIAKRPKMAGKNILFSFAISRGKGMSLQATPDARL